MAWKKSRPLRFAEPRARRRPARRAKPVRFARRRGRRGRREGLRGYLARWRLPLLILGLIFLGALWNDAQLLEPPAFLQTAPEYPSAQFTRCGRGRGHHCVIDGDTFKIGERAIRVSGIDTPETAARCAAEALAAEAATQALQDWLSRGPFQLTKRKDEPVDRYGRELGIVKRVAPDGTSEGLAAWMIDQGHARRYAGGYRGSWC